MIITTIYFGTLEYKRRFVKRLNFGALKWMAAVILLIFGLPYIHIRTIKWHPPFSIGLKLNLSVGPELPI